MPFTFRGLILIALACWSLVATARDAAPGRPADRVVQSELTGSDHRTVRRVPFDVPEGTASVAVRVRHDGANDRTVVDIGLDDPFGFRGWSGGNKSYFEVGLYRSTPSYLPGPLPAGRWSLVLSMPNVRPSATAKVTAEIWFLSEQEEQRGRLVLKDQPGWYRGELHSHTGHSDGTCLSTSRRRVGCPVFLTAQRAADEGLDFIAITDHNTVSHFQAMEEAQAYFDQLLLLPGMELTTFWGHANLIGITAPIDHVRATRSPRDLSEVVKQARQRGAFAIINHPGLPSGEECMGCGWNPVAGEGLEVDAVEVFNGSVIQTQAGLIEGSLSGYQHWLGQVRSGRRALPIGASDNHDPQRLRELQGSIGRPSTVVMARNLSASAILDGLREGRAFVDLVGVKGRVVDLSLVTEQGAVPMGSTAALAVGRTYQLGLQATELPKGAVIQWMVDGAPFAESRDAHGGTQHFVVEFRPGKVGWQALFARVLNEDGRLIAFTGPVYAEVQRDQIAQ